MTPEVIAAYIAIGIAILGFLVWCGRLIQRVETTEKDLDETKEDVAKVKATTEVALDKQAEIFNGILEKHLEADLLRDNKVNTLKDEMQKYVRDQIKQGEQLRQSREQTLELKQEFDVLKTQVEGIKETTFDIKQDVVHLSTVLDQLVEVSKATQQTVQKILESNLQERK